jgi:hypothetical protein
MPIERNGRVVSNTGGQMTTHEPGAYASVLQKVCAEIAQGEQGNAVLLDDETALDEQQEQCAQRTAELMRERHGKPVNCRSYQLPSGLPAPFERFPVGGQRGFTVTPNDQIILKPRQVKSA